jgi:membrane-associated phospholipid phosphatase
MTPEQVKGAQRYGSLAALGLVAVVAGALPFLALLALVQTRWAPLERLDLMVADGLNAWLADNPAWQRPTEVASELGGGATATVVLTIAVFWLLIRAQPRVALFVAVTGLGLAVLVPVSKAVVGRERPDVLVPLVELPTNASFPSGHAMTSLVTWGVLVVAAWPLVHRRRLLATVTTLVVVLVGFTRLVLGVHYVSDVLAGWALGAAWLAASTAAFHRWLRYRHDLLHTDDDTPAARSSLHLAPVDEPALGGGSGAAARIGLGALGIVVALVGLGELLTRLSADHRVLEWDQRVVESIADGRTDQTTVLVGTIEWFSGLWGVVVATVAVGALAMAYRGSWRPVAFVLLAVVGEVLIYGAVSQLVGRLRPDVPDLTTGLPVGASFPSGHTAAATAIYGAMVVLVFASTRRWWRWLVLLGTGLLLGATMLGRLYVAAHYPTDTFAGAFLGLAWLAVLSRWVLVMPMDEPWPSWRQELFPGPSNDDSAATERQRATPVR